MCFHQSMNLKSLSWSDVSLVRVFCCVLQVLSPEEEALAASNDYNFDHPGAFDFEFLVAIPRKLKQGKSVKIPVYDFTMHKRQKDWVRCFNQGLNVHRFGPKKQKWSVWYFFCGISWKYFSDLIKSFAVYFWEWHSAALMLLPPLNTLSMQKNVYGASVIIFEGILSFADKELLQVRQHIFPLFYFLFEDFFNNKAS